MNQFLIDRCHLVNAEKYHRSFDSNKLLQTVANRFDYRSIRYSVPRSQKLNVRFEAKKNGWWAKWLRPKRVQS
jgi:hypothetical protein